MMEIPGGRGGEGWTWEPWKSDEQEIRTQQGGNSRLECRTRTGRDVTARNGAGTGAPRGGVVGRPRPGP